MKLVDAGALKATVSRLKAFAEGVKNISCKAGQMVSLDAIEQKIEALPDASQPLRERVAELEGALKQIRGQFLPGRMLYSTQTRALDKIKMIADEALLREPDHE